MAQDFENVFDLDDLSDAELRELVRDQLAQDDSLDVAGILVHVKDGYVTLAGRVGTEGEKQIADHVLERCHRTRVVLERPARRSGAAR